MRPTESRAVLDNRLGNCQQFDLPLLLEGQKLNSKASYTLIYRILDSL